MTTVEDYDISRVHRMFAPQASWGGGNSADTRADEVPELDVTRQGSVEGPEPITANVAASAVSAAPQGAAGDGTGPVTAQSYAGAPAPERPSAVYAPYAVPGEEPEDDVPEVEDIAGLQAVIANLKRQQSANRPLTRAERERMERRARTDGMIAGAGDMARALANLAFTINYAPDAYKAGGAMAPKVKARFDKMMADRQAESDRYYDFAARIAQGQQAIADRRAAARAARDKARADQYRWQIEQQLKAAEGEADRQNRLAVQSARDAAADARAAADRGSRERVAAANRSAANYRHSTPGARIPPMSDRQDADHPFPAGPNGPWFAKNEDAASYALFQGTARTVPEQNTMQVRPHHSQFGDTITSIDTIQNTRFRTVPTLTPSVTPTRPSQRDTSMDMPIIINNEQ